MGFFAFGGQVNRMQTRERFPFADIELDFEPSGNGGEEGGFLAAENECLYFMVVAVHFDFLVHDEVPKQ